MFFCESEKMPTKPSKRKGGSLIRQRALGAIVIQCSPALLATYCADCVSTCFLLSTCEKQSHNATRSTMIHCSHAYCCRISGPVSCPALDPFDGASVEQPGLTVFSVATGSYIVEVSLTSLLAIKPVINKIEWVGSGGELICSDLYPRMYLGDCLMQEAYLGGEPGMWHRWIRGSSFFSIENLLIS